MGAKLKSWNQISSANSQPLHPGYPFKIPFGKWTWSILFEDDFIGKSYGFSRNSQKYGENSKKYRENSQKYGENFKNYGENSKNYGEKKLEEVRRKILQRTLYSDFTGADIWELLTYLSLANSFVIGTAVINTHTHTCTPGSHPTSAGIAFLKLCVRVWDPERVSVCVCV